MREATDSEKGFTDAPNVWYDGKFGIVKYQTPNINIRIRRDHY